MTIDIREGVEGSALTIERIKTLHDEFYDNLPSEGGRMVRPRFAREGTLNTREIGERLGLKAFDTALPMQWYEDVHDKTGVWPQMLGFVWCYEKATVFGEPIPCSYAALMLLRWYEAVR